MGLVRDGRLPSVMDSALGTSPGRALRVIYSPAHTPLRRPAYHLPSPVLLIPRVASPLPTHLASAHMKRHTTARLLPFGPHKDNSTPIYHPPSLPTTTMLFASPELKSPIALTMAPEPILLGLPPRTRARTSTPSMLSEASFASSSSSSSASSAFSAISPSSMSSPPSSVPPSPSYVPHLP
ncbi:hypothetical protein EW146_g10114 [Bondarzewia mesenterica]|uniref:Uncharacterized protein n=1 Tax=Bondarzewia mesenterica TaxID=1095465 RepID=A0A4S4L1P6_9AGAM|nr:hypothetical protein EW146_g10114 [Bondarzewia mesenterica]